MLFSNLIEAKTGESVTVDFTPTAEHAERLRKIGLRAAAFGQRVKEISEANGGELFAARLIR